MARFDYQVVSIEELMPGYWRVYAVHGRETRLGSDPYDPADDAYRYKDTLAGQGWEWLHQQTVSATSDTGELPVGSGTRPGMTHHIKHWRFQRCVDD
jgi:hypothetical protein